MCVARDCFLEGMRPGGAIAVAVSRAGDCGVQYVQDEMLAVVVMLITGHLLKTKEL